MSIQLHHSASPISQAHLDGGCKVHGFPWGRSEGQGSCNSKITEFQQALWIACINSNSFISQFDCFELFWKFCSKLFISLKARRGPFSGLSHFASTWSYNHRWCHPAAPPLFHWSGRNFLTLHLSELQAASTPSASSCPWETLFRSFESPDPSEPPSVPAVHGPTRNV